MKRLAPDGRLKDSFAVEPLRLPPYAGRVSGELPLYAAGYIQTLNARFPDFELRGEGKSNINVQTAYDIYFTTPWMGRRTSGAVLYCPSPAGVREGVAIVMLTSTHPPLPANQPPEVAVTGVLGRPCAASASARRRRCAAREPRPPERLAVAALDTAGPGEPVVGAGAERDVDVELEVVVGVDVELEVVVELEVELVADVDVDVDVVVEGGGVEVEVEAEVRGGEEGRGRRRAVQVLVEGPLRVGAVGSSVVPLVTSVIWTSLSLAVLSAPAGVVAAVVVAGLVAGGLTEGCLRWLVRRAESRAAVLSGCACSLTTVGSPRG